MGEDDTVISRLLCYGSQFAHRSVLHSHQVELTGCFRREDNNYFIDGNTMHIHTYVHAVQKYMHGTYLCICI